MTEGKTINIHGKEYMPVNERVKMAHDNGSKALSITTEVLYTEPVVIKATVVTDKGMFTGISAANPTKVIEKQSPYEVAETSAVGRALGFAGYGIVDGIASADEIVVATKGETMETAGQRVVNKMQATANQHANCEPGTPFKILESHSTNNFGRKYKKCDGCGAFIGWASNPATEEEPPIEEFKEDPTF